MLIAAPDGDGAKESGKLYYGAATVMQLLDRLGLTPAGRHQLGIIDGDNDIDELTEAIDRLGRPRLVGGGARVAGSEDLDAAR